LSNLCTANGGIFVKEKDCTLWIGGSAGSTAQSITSVANEDHDNDDDEGMTNMMDDCVHMTMGCEGHGNRFRR